MNERLPLLRFTRALIPGTRHSVRSDRTDLAIGDRVVVVLEQPDGSLSGVGTAAVIHHIDIRGDRTVLDLTGEALVSVAARETPDVEVRPIDEPGATVDESLVARAQRALTSYMAARAEAGLGGDIHAALDSDLVQASHQVASHLEISWPEVQDILEAGSASERLHLEIQVLQRETLLLHAVLGRDD